MSSLVLLALSGCAYVSPKELGDRLTPVDCDSPAVWYGDRDGDGYGDAATTKTACVAPDGYVAAGTDCDDTVASTNPGTVDVCRDGVDESCGAQTCGVASGALSGTGLHGLVDGGAAGISVAVVGDVDGDGLADVLVGASSSAEGEDFGTAYLVFGSTSMSLSAGNPRFDGVSQDGTGRAVAGAGDVNGDGHADLLFGAVSGGDSAGGAAYLVLGSTAPASMALSSADAEFMGEASDAAGASVAAAGDINGDGYGDILVGAPGSLSGAGSAFLILGSAAPASLALSASSARYDGSAVVGQAGCSVAGLGDFDGDDRDDWMVGAYYDGVDGESGGPGAAYLILGTDAPASTVLSSADAAFQGEAPDDAAGWSVGGADVNGDGYADALVGAVSNSDAGTAAGAVYLVLGSALPGGVALSDAVEFQGIAAGDGAGVSVAGAGDLDHDGYGDVIVGANGSDAAADNGGAAYVVYGSASPGSISLSAADATFWGDEAFEHAGCSVGAGDVDGDGYADLLIGADGSGQDGAATGAAWLVFGTRT